MDTWPAALDAARVLTTWAVDRDTVSAADAAAMGQVLAWAIWRAADGAEPGAARLVEPMRYLNGATAHARLLAGPRPADLALADPEPVLAGAERVLRAHLDAVAAESLPPTRATTRSNRFVTIADRLTELAAATYLPLAWPVATVIGDAARMVNAAHWVPDADERWAAERLHPLLVAAPAYPPTPEALEATWLQRLLQITSVGTVAREVLGLRPALASRAIGVALQAVAELGEVLSAMATGLEAAWNGRPIGLSLPNWEDAHLLPAVRREIRTAEDALIYLTSLLDAARGGPVGGEGS